MEKSTPEAVYQKRINDLSAELDQLKQKKSVIAWTRFFLMIAIIASFYYIKPYSLTYAFVAATALTLIFFRLVELSTRNNNKISNLDLLLSINQQELDIAAGKYNMLPDGIAMLPALHDYAHDLDIFGRASIYQYINRTTSDHGNLELSKWLLAPSPNTDILARQQAAKELASKYEWRQQLQAYGLANKITNNTQDRINNWQKEPNRFDGKNWLWLRFVLPALILSALVCMLADIIPVEIFFGIFFIFLLVALSISRKVNPIYQHLDKIIKQVETMAFTMDWIEKQQFEAPLLKQIQSKYFNGSRKASHEVANLKEILVRLELRLNPILFIILNTLLFWDLHQVLALEKWKNRNTASINAWFEAFGNMEALSTVAAISFNHPAWAFPSMSGQHGTLLGEELGHPLIPASKRVTSSFNTDGIAQLALITGSNMAGKSTFLRSLGVNIVLAMMGAPVCAKSLTVSNMRVISSMRIADNLEENTSTFYAELKKLKYIIDAVNQHDKVFLLLDEILRGTNSLDRQIGSKALIKQLIKQEAVGTLATHDLELADLIKDYPANIHNYHFDVQVENEELFFDYKLKEGICKSLNASILMKKIGIEL